MSSRTLTRLRARAAVAVVSLAGITGLQLAGAASASAATCDNTLGGNSYAFIASDPAGQVYDFTSTGDLLDGGGRDAWDDWDLANVDGTAYDAAGLNCTTELNGRQFAYPEIDMSGLKVSRKVYVPSAGPGFSRLVTFLRNPSGAPITVTLAFSGNLGSDSSTVILATSSGDANIADPSNDIWAVSADDPTLPSDPPLAHVWDSAASVGVADHVDHLFGNSATLPWANNQDNVEATYDNVTVPPGATTAYMQIESERGQISDALAAAPALAAPAFDVFAGLTDTELSELQNWNGNDMDQDGVANTADNCRFAANPDQADLDRDGSGDTCDSDIDNDGSSNSDEAVRGTDPRKVDTDGDGVNDKGDACPTVAGKGANGCPRFDDSTPPALTLSASSKLKRKAALKGIKVAATTNEASTVVFEVFASAKTAHVAKSYNLALASKTLKGVTGRRSVTLKPKKSLIGKAKRFTLQVKVTATDAFGNRTVKTKTIKVR